MRETAIDIFSGGVAGMVGTAMGHPFDTLKKKGFQGSPVNNSGVCMFGTIQLRNIYSEQNWLYVRNIHPCI